MEANDITIRTATAEDLPLLRQLSRQTFIEAFAAQNTPENMAAYMDAAFSDTQLVEELRESGSTFFLAFNGPHLVGYAKVRTLKKQPALAGFRAMEIQRIYVLARMKGLKIGKRLMQTCLDTARSLGCEVMWLGVWEHNPAAIAFYQRWGFEQFSSYVFHFGSENQTDWLMRKWLDAPEVMEQ